MVPAKLRMKCRPQAVFVPSRQQLHFLETILFSTAIIVSASRNLGVICSAVCRLLAIS